MKTINDLEKLSDDELRVMIAPLVGWLNVHWYEDNAGPPILCGDPPATYKKRHKYDSAVPNYPHDLNATAAVKAMLTKRQKEVFIDILDGSIMAETHPTKYIGYIEQPPEDIFDNFNNASPRKECIALILTLQPHE